ncbi:MAG: aldose 1-epimerase [Actinomycetota bacterium]|nr:aldose 1-epimerase [Actinomycetota bacterium]
MRTTQPSVTVTRADAGTLRDGSPIDRYEIRGERLKAAVLTYGGTLQELWVPDPDGVAADVVLGLPAASAYEDPHPFFGALIGRFGNRIAGATFELNGRTVHLTANEDTKCLHGGPEGFHARVWAAQPLPDGVRLSLDSPAGDGGFPAALQVTVDYVVDGDELRIEYRVRNTEPAGGDSTVVNLTNHAYFNLSGEGTGEVGDHVVQLFGDAYLPVDEAMIPTGEQATVEGTPFDLREPRPFSDGWDSTHEQVRRAGGYDHTWVVQAGSETGGQAPVVLAARVTDPGSGRVMEVLTDQPGVQFYTGNSLDGCCTGKSGASYTRRTGFCLETQHFPDSPHQPAFPSTVLEAGGSLHSVTVLRFGTR